MTEQETRIVSLFFGGESRCAEVMQYFFKEAPDIALACLLASRKNFSLDPESYQKEVLAAMSPPLLYPLALHLLTDELYTASKVLSSLAYQMPSMLSALLISMDESSAAPNLVNPRATNVEAQLTAVVNLEVLPLDLTKDRVPGIKALRMATGMGLKEAKDMHDMIREASTALTPLNYAALARMPGIHADVLHAHFTNMLKERGEFNEDRPSAGGGVRDTLLRILTAEWDVPDTVVI